MAGRSRSALIAGASGIASAGVGIVLGHWGLALTAEWSRMTSFGQDDYLTTAMSMMSVAVAVLGALAAALGALMRLSGWVVATIGLALVVVSVDPSIAREFDGWGPIVEALALGMGLTLGGLALAIGASPAAGRVAIGAGFATGVATSPFTVEIVRTTIGSELNPLTAGEVVTIAAGTLALVTAVLTLAIGGISDRRSAVGLDLFLPTVGIAITAAAVWGGVTTRPLVMEEIYGSGGTLTSIRRSEAIQELGHYALVAIAVIAGIALTLVALRLGGVNLARWTVLGFGLAAPLLIGLQLYGRTVSPLVLITVGVVGAAAGTLLAIRLDRFAPWDAVGVLLAAAGVLAASPGLREQALWVHEAEASLITFGVGLALAAGLVRLCRTFADRDPGWLAGAAFLGLAAILLTAHALAMIYYPVYTYRADRTPQLTFPVLGAIAALALVVLFAHNRSASRQSLERSTIALD